MLMAGKVAEIGGSARANQGVDFIPSSPLQGSGVPDAVVKAATVLSADFALKRMRLEAFSQDGRRPTISRTLDGDPPQLDFPMIM